jgi:hypothetical protein
VAVRLGLAALRGQLLIEGKESAAVTAPGVVLGALAVVDGTLVGFVGHMPTNPTLVARTSANAPGSPGRPNYR